EDNLDHVAGIAYLKDIVRRDFEAPDVEFTQRIDSMMRPAYFVPESKSIDELLSEMQTRRQHLAIVVDEYGGTARLVTIDGLREEMVGETADEYAGGEIETEQLEEGSVRVSWRYPVAALGELFGFDGGEGAAAWGGGLRAKPLGRAPTPGSGVVAPGLRFTAE